ncbi:MAG: hypothetical protein WA485_02700 [Candidatus Sulfotelmatobacter sp.]
MVAHAYLRNDDGNFTVFEDASAGTDAGQGTGTASCLFALLGCGF